ncbi:MAG: VOC family protein [Pseudomonadales bacterium]|nr:VOC family protein [Pseudomonadales bacterium]
MPANKSINYVELCAQNLEETKQFFTGVFGWGFEDYGPDYAAITGAGLDGGFYRGELKCDYASSGAVVVLFADDLEDAQKRVEAAGGKIDKPIFSFPGGRRFHFVEPSGNELAVWSDK